MGGRLQQETFVLNQVGWRLNLFVVRIAPPKYLNNQVDENNVLMSITL